MITYFAYGSNLNLPHLLDWLLRFGVEPEGISDPRRAILHDFRLRTNYLTNGRHGAANIEPAKGQLVEGLLLTVSPAVQEVLRFKEGFPYRYDESEVFVTIPGRRRRVRAMTYIVTPRHRLPIDLPVSDHYRKLILEGAKSLHLSSSYRQALNHLLITPEMLLARACRLSVCIQPAEPDDDADRRCA